MKRRSVIGLMVSLTIWATDSSPILAQKQYQRSQSAVDEVYLDNYLHVNFNHLTVAQRSPNSGQQTAGRSSSSGSYSTCQSSSNRDISRYCFRLGDSGPLIENLVEDLRVAGYYEGRTTNRFDSRVERAVKRFQQDYRYTASMSVLAVDGIVGPDTLLRLCQATRRGCGPNAGLECYQGSPIGVIGCLERYDQYVTAERSPSRNQQSTAQRSPASGQQTARGRSPNQARSANSSNMTARPQVPTWNQFVASLKEGEDYVASDFDLPQEFRNGYVYRVQGANWIGVYILKAGLPSYPIPGNSEINQVTFDADRYIQSGQAIHLWWNLSHSAIAYANDNQVRFPEKGRGCLAITCLTAPSMSNAQISSILRSERGVSTTASATSNTQRSPNSGQQTAGQSPATSGSRQELVASNLGCTRNLRTILGQRAPDYCTSADAYSGIIFDNVKPPTRNADGSIKLEMTVLNRGSADGFVEIYDSRGSLVQLEVIESSSPPTDLIRNINPFDQRSFPASFFSNYPIGDLRRSLKRQDISVTIPAGGYAKVTKYGNIAFRYNSAMLSLELIQAAKGDPEFVKSETVKNFIKGFAEEAFFARDSKAVINIFKSPPSLQAQFNMNVIDPNKLAKVLQELVEYSVKIEKDPSKNPFIGAFQDVFLDGATIGLENAVNLLLPGLGTFASGVRKGGNYINILARAADLYYSMASGEKATVTIRDASTTGRR